MRRIRASGSRQAARSNPLFESDVEPHASRALKGIAQEPGAEPTPSPVRVDQEHRDVRLNEAVRLGLDRADDPSVLDRHQRRHARRAQRAISPLDVYRVLAPALGRNERDQAVEVAFANGLIESSVMCVGRLGEGDRVSVRIGDLHVADAVRVGLDRFVLDPLAREAFEERVEPGDGHGDAACARLRCVWLDEQPGVLVDLPEDLFADAAVRGPTEEARVPVDAGVEIGTGTPAKRWVIRSSQDEPPCKVQSPLRRSRSHLRPRRGVELIGRYRFVADWAVSERLLRLRSRMPEEKCESGAQRPMSMPVLRGSSTDAVARARLEMLQMQKRGRDCWSIKPALSSGRRRLSLSLHINVPRGSRRVVVPRAAHSWNSLGGAVSAKASLGLDFVPQSVFALHHKANGGGSTMQGTHDSAETTTADDGARLDPREAARLFDQTRRDARRQFDLRPPVVSAVMAFVVLLATARCGSRRADSIPTAVLVPARSSWCTPRWPSRSSSGRGSIGARPRASAGHRCDSRRSRGSRS